MIRSFVIFSLLLILFLPFFAHASDEGTVVVAADDTFVIETRWGRQIFKARTYCFGVNKGDEVYFLKSTAVCILNTFVVRRSGRTCNVWCE